MSEAVVLKLLVVLEALLIPVSGALARWITLRQAQRGELEQSYQSFLQESVADNDRLLAELLTKRIDRLSAEHREILERLRDRDHHPGGKS